MLCRTEVGMESGLCMAARASSNVQSTILNEIMKVSTIDACVPNDVRIKCEQERTWGIHHTHLPGMHELWCTMCSVCLLNASCLFFKS